MSEPPVVLFEDAHVVAVAKPAGLPTQGTAPGGSTLESVVRTYLSPGAPGSVYLGTVHRLDRPVSGVVVWAKTPRAARRLSGAFSQGAVVKEYWAIVEGGAAVPGATGVWEDWLSDATDASGVVRRVAPDARGARRAVTRYELGRSDALPGRALWLRLRPETGRTHQLRAQASLRGLPIWGDVSYGASRAFPQGIALHARSITFPHPGLRRPLTVTAGLPATWAEAGLVPG